jgi:outer membrane biosynthesis protein TonB
VPDPEPPVRVSQRAPEPQQPIHGSDNERNVSKSGLGHPDGYEQQEHEFSSVLDDLSGDDNGSSEGSLEGENTGDGGGISPRELVEVQPTPARVRILNGTPPTYPIAYRRQGIEGSVEVFLTFRENGTIKSYRIESYSEEGFKEAVESVIATYVFDIEEPISRSITFQFTLEKIGVV